MTNDTHETADEPTTNCRGTTTDGGTTTDAESACGASTTGTDTGSTCGASTTGADADSSSGSAGGSTTTALDEKVGASADEFDADPGRLVAVGLGPGQEAGMTARARSALLAADHIVGYSTYIDLLPEAVCESADELYDTPMCGEVSRTEEAVDRALAGNHVAIVGSGDPNVYALGGLTLEILESKGTTASAVDFEVVPGVPAAQSCAARVGAPLVNDSVSISLSDHLTPMETIASRLEAVAREGFTIAIYNPWSRKRRENFETACAILCEHRPADTPVGVVHGAGRDDERVEIIDLDELKALGETDLVDMTTTILVGNEETYVWDDRVVTTRGYERKYEY